MLPRLARVLPWFAAALALVPALTMAYLGQFSRMVYDDYCIVRTGRELGAWESTVLWFESWTPGFVGIYLQSALSFLDELLPAIWPALTIALCIASASWLVWQVLTIIGIRRHRAPLSLSVAGLAVAASVNAFPSGQSFYWHTANVRYFLPLAALTLTVALAIWTQRRSDRRLYSAGVLGVATVSFVGAGFSEIFLIFQLASSTLGVLAFPVLTRRQRPIAASAWIGTCISLLIQLQSPGVLARLSHDQWKFGTAALRPSMSALDRLDAAWNLLPDAMELTLRFAGTQEAFAGFALLTCLGLVIALSRLLPASDVPASGEQERLSVPLWLLTLSQILLLPILWNHTSDIPVVFGRFSFAYTVVVILNIVLLFGSILGYGWLLARCFPRHQGLSIVIGVLTGVSSLLFVLAQLRRIHYTAASFLFISTVVTLGIISWTLAAGKATRKIALLGPIAYGLSLTAIFLTICTALLSRGVVTPRILTVGTTLLVLSGLVWGMALGDILRRSSSTKPILLRRFQQGGLIIVLLIATSIAHGKASHVSAYARFAGEWDTRHKKIIAVRDAGQTYIVVEPLISAAGFAAGFAAGEGSPADPEHDCVETYYGVESIRESDSA